MGLAAGRTTSFLAAVAASVLTLHPMSGVAQTASSPVSAQSSLGGETPATSPASGQQRNAQASSNVPASPFAVIKPGQTQAPAPDPAGLKLGLLHWFPIESRCAFGTPDIPAPTTQSAAKPYVFLTMVQTDPNNTATLERGYVLANGLVRELEKGKTAPDKDGNTVTVWRSAGEPRINVNTLLAPPEKRAGDADYSGSLTVFWGDKKESVSITGSCEH